MNFILIFVILYGLLPLIVYQFLKKKLVNIKAIFPFLVVVFIASLYEFIGQVIFKIGNDKWYLIYKILAFFSIHYFFFILLKKKYKAIFIFFILMFFALLYLKFTLWQTYFYFDISSYFNLFQTIIVLFFSIIWFKNVFQQLEINDFLESSMFYFVSGLIICYTGSVFVFLLGSHIYAIDKSGFQYYWLLNIFLNLILRTSLIVGILKARVNKKFL